MDRVIFEIPQDVCDELLRLDDDAFPHPGPNRGAITDVIQVAVESINTATAFVSLLVAGKHVSKAARALLSRASAGSGELEVSIRSKKGVETIQLDPSSASAEEDLAALLKKAIEAGGSGKPGPDAGAPG